ncbi:hypothetical protein [Paenibacillus sp. FSL H7-0326]|uniref:TIR domain-containing protein n=1 Tax=Paenibacillus sp. FSL H7-0326 TaxID=1921144 RepID=UPI0021161DB2|nr:hypothetical protein [Paenibacillus sp. FSL H7-0326]
MSAKQPWDNSWKTNCRTRIKGCDGVIALLSKNTALASGALWEIKCAVDEGVPIIGMHIQKDTVYALPKELSGIKVIEWSWEEIKRFIDRL